MLFIVCGEDVVASRRYFQDLQESYKQKGFYLVSTTTGDLINVLKEEIGTFTLFNEKKALLLDNLTRIINRKSSLEIRELLKQAIENQHLLILDWEAGKSAREITIKDAQIKEFKLPESIFKLLDACYPGNLASFLRIFHELTRHVEPEFVFAMLCRHTRQLLVSSNDALPSSIPSWQRAKLHAQSAKWRQEVLISFYLGLARLDENLKTSKDTIGVKNAIDILASICLR